MQAEVLCIEQEPLRSEKFRYLVQILSEALLEEGYRVARHTTIPDETETVREEIQKALERSPVVLVTGGLGLEGKAQGALEWINQAEALLDSFGLVKGFFYAKQGKILILLPEDPGEVLQTGLARLRQVVSPQKPLFRAVVRLCLLKEPEVRPFVDTLCEAFPHVKAHILPACGSVKILLEGEESVQELAEKIQERFASFCYFEKTLALAVHQKFIAEKMTLGLAESITGGALSAALVEREGASQFLLGSIVAYSNAWKEHFLQVSHSTLQEQGAVSRQTVYEMIRGVFENTQADYAIAVSGIAGPSGGSVQKPVGTVFVGVAQRGRECEIGKIQGPRDRKAILELTVQTALGVLWRRLAYQTGTFL